MKHIGTGTIKGERLNNLNDQEVEILLNNPVALKFVKEIFPYRTYGFIILARLLLNSQHLFPGLFSGFKYWNKYLEFKKQINI